VQQIKYRVKEHELTPPYVSVNYDMPRDFFVWTIELSGEFTRHHPAGSGSDDNTEWRQCSAKKALL